MEADKARRNKKVKSAAGDLPFTPPCSLVLMNCPQGLVCIFFFFLFLRPRLHAINSLEAPIHFLYKVRGSASTSSSLEVMASSHAARSDSHALEYPVPPVRELNKPALYGRKANRLLPLSAFITVGDFRPGTLRKSQVKACGELPAALPPVPRCTGNS